MDELERLSAELERERAFGHAVTDAIESPLVVVRADGTIPLGGVNKAAERLCGYPEAELVGRHFRDVFVSAADRAAAAAWLAEGTALPVELACPSREDGVRLVVWTVQPLGGESEPTSLMVGVDVTSWKRQEDDLHASRARIVEAADAERRRLERNLHDGAQQRLVSMSLELTLLERRMTQDPALADQVERLRSELAACLEELRDLARGLHPAVVTAHGLAVALESLATRAPVPVQCETEDLPRLPDAVEVAIYFFVAECLTNVAKYAGAREARVSVQVTDGEVVAEVADDGVGGADPGDGSGLRGLADRVEALGGRLHIHSPSGGGTRVRAELPCQAAESASASLAAPR